MGGDAGEKPARSGESVVLRFRIEWQEAPGFRVGVLARTWGRLVIEAGGRLVTQAIDSRSESLRGGVYGSVLPLCQWVLENWWFLLNESYQFPVPHAARELAKSPTDRPWVQRHSLLAAREGGALPDLMIFRDDRAVVARWTSDQEASIHPFLRFTGSGEVQMDPAEAEHGLSELVKEVLERLAGIEDPDAKSLREEWAAVLASMQSERERCEWSARLGLDPYNADDLTEEVADMLSGRVSGLEASTRNDLLDAGQALNLQEDLEWLDKAHSAALDAGAPTGAEVRLTRATDARTAHELGYACAQATRQYLSESDGQEPVGDMDDVLHRLGWAQSPSRTVAVQPKGRLEAVLERSDEGGSVAVAHDGDAAGNRFRLARAAFLRHFGSHREGRRIVTKAYTVEQRESRAFAAELLAPAVDIAKHIGDQVSPDEIDQLAQRYKVSPFVVSRQIQNHRLGWINA